MTIPQSQTDRVFLNPVCETVVWPLEDRVKTLIEKKLPGRQTVIWSLAG